ncbi:MAG TPA: LysM peptidoglycan-binding domain-containing protein, partial [Chloroflexota bacterium]|nr:LysM peptidoglycan-binding domain-containing protein [Chloroflexota bacterium]
MYQRFTPQAPGERSSGYGAHPGRGGWVGEYRRECSWETCERPPQGRLATVVQVAIMLAAGPAMYRFVGPPRPPVPWHDLWRGLLTLLDGHRIWSFLTGPGPTYVDIAQVAPWVFLAFWLLWLYVVVMVVLQASLAVADLATRGAAWVRALQAVVDRVTLPQLRRLAHGAVVATAVMQLTARTAGAESPGLQPPAASAVALLPDPDRAAAAAAAADAAQPTQTERVAKYTVAPGDNLWEIAERFYGSGWDHTRIVDANEGRRMADGRVFSGRASSIIHPGWVLDLPMPDVLLEQREGRTEYVVQPSETLAGIATRFLGDEYRWPEIYEPNRASATDLWSVGASTRADQLWPQRRIVLPAELLREAADSVGAAEGLTGLEALRGDSRDVGGHVCAPIRVVAPPESAFDGGSAAPTTAAPPGMLAADVPASGDHLSGSGATEVVETAGVRTVGAGPVPVLPSPLPPLPPLFPSPAAVLAGAAFSAGALAGGTTVLASRRLRRSLDEPPVRLVPARPEPVRRATLKPSQVSA